MSKTYEPQSKSSVEWRALAQENRDERARSFAESDTDGFLSQAASQAMTRLYDRLADIAADGNTAEVPALFRADGSRVERWEWVDGNYGPSVRVISDRKFFSPSNAAKGARRLATDLKKGYSFGTVRGAVTVRMSSNWTPFVELADEAPIVVSAVSARYSQDD